MKILGICASPRKHGNTHRLLKYLLEQCAVRGAETEMLCASECRVGFCTACEQCMRVGTCPIQDDYSRLLPKIHDADGLVLATPNYAFDVSAQMKAVIDRSHALLYYSQMLRGKYGAGVCVGGHPLLTAGLAKRCAQAVWLCGGSAVGAVWGVSKHRDHQGFVHSRRVYRRADRLAQRLVDTIQKRKPYPFQKWANRTLLLPNLLRVFTRRKEEYPYVHSQLSRLFR